MGFFKNIGTEVREFEEGVWYEPGTILIDPSNGNLINTISCTKRDQFLFCEECYFAKECDMYGADSNTPACDTYYEGGPIKHCCYFKKIEK